MLRSLKRMVQGSVTWLLVIVTFEPRVFDWKNARGNGRGRTPQGVRACMMGVG